MADEEEEFMDTVPDEEKTPVTIVTGFLGSGKTTLVNYILKEQTNYKICVVENEFGEVAIDNDLVEENLSTREDIITMDNGCVCCSVRGDLVRTFAMLNSKRKEFDAVILETTGLADPSPIVFTFNSNALIQDNYRIDSVVCLVDAKHVGIHLDEVKPDGNINEAEHQIAFSDRILLNKLDLVNAEELQDTTDRIKAINSFATVIKTERSRAPLDQILGLNSFSMAKLEEIDPTILEEDEEEPEHTHVHDEHCTHDHEHEHNHVHGENCNHGGCSHPSHDHGHDNAHGHDGHDSAHEHAHGHDHAHESNACTEDHDHSGHDHKHGHEHEEHKETKKKKKKTHNLSLVSSVGFTIEGDLDVPVFNTFMSELLRTKAADIYRSKGVLSFADQGDVKFVFQGVHDNINFGPTDKPWKTDETRLSKMVFIGKNLDYENLKQGLLASTVDPASAKITMHKRA